VKPGVLAVEKRTFLVFTESGSQRDRFSPAYVRKSADPGISGIPILTTKKPAAPQE
jgi:hypothetical protein